MRQGLWLSLLATVGAVITVRHMASLLVWIRISPDLVPITTAYLNAMSWGIPATCMFQVLRSFSEGVSITRPVMYTSLIALSGNIAGNYVFMYGKFGMPRLGAVGCSVASALMMWANLAMIASYIGLRKEYRRFAPYAQFDRPRSVELLKLVKLGGPIAGSMFIEASLFAAVALLMGTLGTNMVAGHQIAINVASITFMVPLGLAMAISVRVGQAVGRGDLKAAQTAGYVGVSLAGAFMAASSAFILIFANSIAGVYTRDPAVHRIAVTLLFMAAFFQISDGLQVSGSGALRGLKDTTVPMIITIFAYWVIAFPLGFVLGIVLHYGAIGMWTGFIAGLTTSALLLNSRFHLVTRRLIRAAPQAASTTERMV